MNRKEEKQLIIDILTTAFDENKSVNYVAKQGSYRTRHVRALMDYSYEICKAFGEVRLSEDQSSCALLLHQRKENLFAQLQDIKLVFRSIGLKKVLKVLKREKMIKQNHPETPFCYLWYIGTSPEQQRQGKGSKLLNEIITYYDERNLPLYLETSTQTNIPWYEKSGFQTYNKINDFGFELFLMRRSLSS